MVSPCRLGLSFPRTADPPPPPPLLLMFSTLSCVSTVGPVHLSLWCLVCAQLRLGDGGGGQGFFDCTRIQRQTQPKPQSNILLWIGNLQGSVEDPGCLSLIPDPDFSPSQIPNFGSRIPDLGSRISDPGSNQKGGGKIFLKKSV